MIAKVSENGYLKLIIVLNGMTFLYGYRQTKLVAFGSCVNWVAQMNMVEFVQQGKEKFPNLEVAYVQKFVVDSEILFSQLVSITS